MKWNIICEAKVDLLFIFKRLDCTMGLVLDTEKDITHHHGSYTQKQLTQEELGKLDAMVRTHLSLQLLLCSVLLMAETPNPKNS